MAVGCRDEQRAHGPRNHVLVGGGDGGRRVDRDRATFERSVMTSSAGVSSVTGLAAGCASAHGPLAAREMDASGW
jgi:hypothetical protein